MKPAWLHRKPSIQIPCISQCQTYTETCPTPAITMNYIQTWTQFYQTLSNIRYITSDKQYPPQLRIPAFRQAISTTAQDTCLHMAPGAVLSEARLKHAHLHTEMSRTALHALCANFLQPSKYKFHINCGWGSGSWRLRHQ